VLNMGLKWCEDKGLLLKLMKSNLEDVNWIDGTWVFGGFERGSKNVS